MSYILKQGSLVVAVSGGWNPALFGKHTGVSFPAEVSNGYSWSQNGWDLVWEDDPTPEPAAGNPVPDAVSPRQIRMALTRFNLREQVETAVAAGDQDLKDWWEFSLSFERNHEQVSVMAAALGATEESLDQLWILAGSL